MKRIVTLALFSFLIHMAGNAGLSQLRSPSEYNQDGIDRENTYFVLYESGQALYGWASQWVQDTARTYEDRVAFFKWHFQDGSVAYARQGEKVGDIGMITKYLLTDEAETLTDIDGEALQPMTRENYPTKVELWMGKPDEQEVFKEEILVDAACNKRKSIQNGFAYYFSGCEK